MLSTMASVGPCSLCVTVPQFRVRKSPTATPLRFVQGGVREIRTIVCSGETGQSEERHNEPPKLEPFNQSRLTRAMRERSFLQKTQDALNEKCLALEGDAAYECWEALFEYENIKEEAETECNIAEPGDQQEACKPLERLENMVRQSGGVNSLIDNVLMVAKINEVKKNKAPPSEEEWLKAVSATDEDVQPSDRLEFLEDGGIPKSEKELQEEIESLMPDSQFTKVLKRRGHKSGA